MIELVALPLIAGLLLCLAAGPFGCFVVWKRMAYMGDTLAHSALLGVALALLFEWHPSFGLIFISILVGFALSQETLQKFISSDLLLGIISYGSLAVALCALSLFAPQQVDFKGLLMGDLLTVDIIDIGALGLVCMLALTFLIRNWASLLLLTIDPALYRVEANNAKLLQMALNISIGLIIALGVQVVGALLIGALLILPPATARLSSRSPEAMAGLACVCGIVSLLGGFAASIFLDIAPGPAIVCVCLVLFLLIQTRSALLSK
jgi:zinc transport system permease protein